ncbi:hypothetical protein TURU_143575 [Turdus rufiventris]|nr:hypothetical protein TURU_143575 [Turdus rufiventris]
MMQPDLFCEMGQFIKASQSKDKTLKLELAYRGYREKPTLRVSSVSGSLGQAPEGHKGRMVWEESSLGLEEKQSTPFPRQRSEPSLLPPDEEVADKK